MYAAIQWPLGLNLDVACDSSFPTGRFRVRQTIRWDCQLKKTHTEKSMSVHQFAYKRKNNI